MRKPSFYGIYTERREGDAALLIVFVNRDDQAVADVEGTKVNLEADGEGVHVREFDLLSEIPDLWDLKREARDRAAAQAAQAAAIAQSARLDQSRLAIHDCLKLLAGHCDGARTLDGSGFNKMDAQFGRDLAESRQLSDKQADCGAKLIRKYHKQLPKALFDQALAYLPADSGPVAQSLGGHLAELDARPVGQPAPSTMASPARTINQKYQNRSGQDVAGNGCEEPYGDTYQNGVKPGLNKLAQFVEVLTLSGIPKLYAQDGKGDQAIAYVKLFDPCGAWTAYLTEFSPVAPDGMLNLAFGLVDLGQEPELGYSDLAEIANAKGRMGIGMEIDMHFTPRTIAQCRGLDAESEALAIEAAHN